MKKRTWWGVLFGAVLAIGTAFAALPMEALAEGSCQWGGDLSCDGNTHNHEVTVGTGQEISVGTFKNSVTVEGGIISGGTFENMVMLKSGEIKGGTFKWNINVIGGRISNVTEATNSGQVFLNGGEISGGTFDKKIQVGKNGTITGGTFNHAGTHTFDGGTIAGGTFNKFSYNDGSIMGGCFYCDIENGESSDPLSLYGTILGGTFYGKVTNQWNSEIKNGIFYDTVTNEGTITGGAYAKEIQGNGHVSGIGPIPVAPEKTADGGTTSYGGVQDGSVAIVKGLCDEIKNAPQNGTATLDSEWLYTISDYIIKKLAKRTDITMVITFEYQNRAYKMTIPAGADFTSLLADEDYFYGYFFFANAVGATIEAL